ncbi:beta-sandwich domain-containing protein [Bdellovibrio bacteriovorus]|uniref:beta-sandwich domain-containing protein n=1 Tax=Bdellovibrio bacteriovorus TaxID=959 RepID=UPI003A7FB767
MKRSGLAAFMALLSLTHNTAHADIIVDLPFPGEFEGDVVTAPTTPPAPPAEDTTQTQPTTTPAAPAAPVQTEYKGELSITSMSRKSGGATYKIDLQRSAVLNRLELVVEVNKLKIHSASLITDSGREIQVREFKDTRVLSTWESLTSENLNLSDRVVSIEMVAESYGGAANIRLRAIGATDVPRLTLQQVIEPVAATPTAPPAPSNPVIPVRNEPIVQNSTPSAIAKGSKVVYSGSYVGTIVQILGGGKVRVTLDGYSGTHDVDLREIATQTACLDGLCGGYNILYSNSYSGVIKEVFSNKKARVVLDGYSGLHIVNLSELARSVDCHQNFCINRQAIYSNSYDATIKKLFTNGKAQVVLAGYSGLHIVSLSELANVIQCAKEMCVGDSVMYSNTYKAKILKVYGNGKAQVTLEGYSGTHMVNISELTRPTRCLDGVCAGDSLMYDRTMDAKVIEVYNNRQALITIAGYNGTHTVAISSLSKKINCASGICVGDQLMYDFTMKAKVIKVFSHGQALITIEGYNGTHTVSLQSLTKPVTCSKGICAGDRVTYDRSYTGKVISVFGNGTALVTLNGYSGTHNVSLSSLVKMR